MRLVENHGVSLKIMAGAKDIYINLYRHDIMKRRLRDIWPQSFSSSALLVLLAPLSVTTHLGGKTFDYLLSLLLFPSLQQVVRHLRMHATRSATASFVIRDGSTCSKLGHT